MRIQSYFTRNCLIIMFLFLVSWPELYARTKLTTLPNRLQIRMDLKNEGFILVEEERAINLQKGINQVEFAWANTFIDMQSIQFRTIEAPGPVTVLNVNYPPNESALFWEVSSAKAGPGIFRISYLISNIERFISYEAISDKNEKNMSLKTYFTLKNLSGEKFENARLEMNFGQDFHKGFEIGEAKKMLAAKFMKIPISKKYIFDHGIDSENVRMFYEIKNSETSGLGRFPLPRGKIRIFQEDSAGTEAFLGEDWAAYTPVGETMPVYLGQAKEVIVKRFVFSNTEKIIDGPLKDIHQVIKYRVENFKKDSVPLTIMDHFDGEWVLDKIELKEETGERDKISEQILSQSDYIKTEKQDIQNFKILFNTPVSVNKKYNLYAHIILKNRW